MLKSEHIHLKAEHLRPFLRLIKLYFNQVNWNNCTTVFFCQILQRSEGWDQPFITMSNVIKCGRHYGTERKFLSATLTNIILEIEFFIHFFHGIVFVRGIGVTVPRLWLRIFLFLQEKKSVKSVHFDHFVYLKSIICHISVSLWFFCPFLWPHQCRQTEKSMLNLKSFSSTKKTLNSFLSIKHIFHFPM